MFGKYFLKKLTVDTIKKKITNGIYKCTVFSDHVTIEIRDIIDIHKYVMKKHNII